MICLSTDTDQWPSQTAVSVIMTDLQARVMICLSTDTDQWPSETAVCVIITDLQARVMICLSTDTDQWPSETPVCCYCSKIPRPRLKSLHVHRHCPVTSRESACLSTLTCGHWKCCPPPHLSSPPMWKEGTGVADQRPSQTSVQCWRWCLSDYFKSLKQEVS